MIVLFLSKVYSPVKDIFDYISFLPVYFIKSRLLLELIIADGIKMIKYIDGNLFYSPRGR